MRRRALLTASVSATVPKPTFPVTLKYSTNNGQAGIELYNYLISKLPQSTRVTIPNTTYDVGAIKLEFGGYIYDIRACMVLPSGFIVLSCPELEVEGFTPSLNRNGFVS